MKKRDIKKANNHNAYLENMAMNTRCENKNIGEYHITKHADVRMQQRGLSKFQIELVMKHGEPVEDGYVMTQRAVDCRVAELKYEMKLLERLSNIAVIDLKGTVATTYRVSDRRIHSMLHA